MLKALLVAAVVALGSQAALAVTAGGKPTRSDDASAAQPSEPWFILATKKGECRRLRAMFDVDTPEAVMTLFAGVGHPLEVAGDKGDYMLLKLAGQPNDPGMALVRGAGPCNEFLKILQAVGK
jgi:hypothetical protein